MTIKGIVLVTSVSITQDDLVLLVQENKLSVKDKWSFPGGRIEIGEDVIQAAVREVKEETGYDVRLINTTGIYNFLSSTNHQVIMIHFNGVVVGGSLQPGSSEIKDCRWIPLTDVLMNQGMDFRDAGVMKQIVENMIEDQHHALTVFNSSLILTPG